MRWTQSGEIRAAPPYMLGQQVHFNSTTPALQAQLGRKQGTRNDEMADLPGPTMIESLPRELLAKILTLLPSVSDLAVNIASVCKHWSSVANDSIVWSSLFVNSYIVYTPTVSFPIRLNWKELYKLAHSYIPKELEKHKHARQLLNLDVNESRIQMLDDFYQGIPPDQNGEYASYVPNATPLWFQFDSVKNQWYWTPDHVAWMPITTDVVQGGLWNGQRPVPRNRTLLTILSHYKLAPLSIHTEIQYYPSVLFFQHHMSGQNTDPDTSLASDLAIPHHVLCANQNEDEVAFEDILVSIFEWLDPCSLSAAARVCADWARIVAANYRRLCRLMCDSWFIKSVVGSESLAALIDMDPTSLFKHLWTSVRPKVKSYVPLRREVVDPSIWHACGTNHIFDGEIPYDPRWGYQLGPLEQLGGTVWVRHSPKTLQWEWSANKKLWALLAVRMPFGLGGQPRLLGEEMVSSHAMKLLLMVLAIVLSRTEPPVASFAVTIQPQLQLGL